MNGTNIIGSGAVCDLNFDQKSLFFGLINRLVVKFLHKGLA
jgi:hypothetical protein